MGCLSCGRGFHSECKKCARKACHPDVNKLAKTLNIGPKKHTRRVSKEKTNSERTVGAPVKDPSKVGDRFSTGRKRAAALYPIFEGSPCEWKGKKNCGGGSPIVGCLNGVQTDRHHGPIKDTLRNEPTNIHKICKTCHNRWHTVNDPIYDAAEYENLPHKPEPATELEILANEAKWRIK